MKNYFVAELQHVAAEWTAGYLSLCYRGGSLKRLMGHSSLYWQVVSAAILRRQSYTCEELADLDIRASLAVQLRTESLILSKVAFQALVHHFRSKSKELNNADILNAFAHVISNGPTCLSHEVILFLSEIYESEMLDNCLASGLVEALFSLASSSNSQALSALHLLGEMSKGAADIKLLVRNKVGFKVIVEKINHSDPACRRAALQLSQNLCDGDLESKHAFLKAGGLGELVQVPAQDRNKEYSWFLSELCFGALGIDGDQGDLYYETLSLLISGDSPGPWKIAGAIVLEYGFSLVDILFSYYVVLVIEDASVNIPAQFSKPRFLWGLIIQFKFMVDSYNQFPADIKRLKVLMGSFFDEFTGSLIDAICVLIKVTPFSKGWLKDPEKLSVPDEAREELSNFDFLATLMKLSREGDSPFDQEKLSVLLKELNSGESKMQSVPGLVLTGSAQNIKEGSSSSPKQVVLHT